ncbi:MAG TPA: hypothetical protein VH437_02950 [Terriglobales bacterium]|jgi:hypothetical protein
MRDPLPFQGSYVAKRTYMIDLSRLPTGEYGLLSPGSSMASSARAQLGKMYTFSLGRMQSVDSPAGAPPAKRSWKQTVLKKADPF